MTSKGRTAKVYHADLWGRREEKYAWLQDHDWRITDWREIRPASEFYLFVPSDATLRERYSQFVKVTDIFPVNSVGIVTARDSLTIRWTPDEMWTTALNFSKLESELARQAYSLGRDARDWKVPLAQEDLRQSGPDRHHIVPILYRPFDLRYTYYTGQSRGFIGQPQRAVMGQMLGGDNLGMSTTRSVEIGQGFQHVFCTSYPIQHHTVSLKEVNYLFPLHLYGDRGQGKLLPAHAPAERQPNLNSEIVVALAKAYGGEPTPEQIFHYVYAVLYAPTYREKYAEFLRLDFPRVPFTQDPELFKKVAELGKRLVDLHLLRSPELDPPIARFQGEGDGKVLVSGKKGLRYDAERERVYINPTQYFEGVPPEVWEYQIGGYQVCHKWLKDRKDRKLALDEIRTYCRIATALVKTIEIQHQIDSIYASVEGTVSQPTDSPARG